MPRRPRNPASEERNTVSPGIPVRESMWLSEIIEDTVEATPDEGMVDDIASLFDPLSNGWDEVVAIAEAATPSYSVTSSPIQTVQWVTSATATGLRGVRTTPSTVIEDEIQHLSRFLNPTPPPAVEEANGVGGFFDRFRADRADVPRPRARGRDRHPRQDTRGDDNRPESYQRPYWVMGYMDGDNLIAVRATNEYHDACDFMQFNGKHYSVVEFYDGTPGKMSAVWRGDHKRLKEQNPADIKGYEGPILTFKEPKRVFFTEERQADFRAAFQERVDAAWELLSDRMHEDNMDEEFAIRLGSDLHESMNLACSEYSESIREYQRLIIAPNLT
jgi:hypothetical protein